MTDDSTKLGARPTTTRSPATLTVDSLGVALAGRSVLHDVSIQVHPGEVLGIVGPNGAGKTTLLRTVLGLTPAHTGTVQIAGDHPRSDREIGYVPQRHEFAWDFPIDVTETIVSGRARSIGWLRRPTTADYDAAHEAMELVHLTDLRRRAIGELSGGQRQRVLVARALALRPSVLLLDEPFTGLDVPSQELLVDLFGRLAADGTALVMTTHDLPGAMHTCSHLCLLNRTVVAAGPPRDLADPEVWMRAFGFRDDSPLLHVLTANGRPA